MDTKGHVFRVGDKVYIYGLCFKNNELKLHQNSDSFLSSTLKYLKNQNINMIDLSIDSKMSCFNLVYQYTFQDGTTKLGNLNKYHKYASETSVGYIETVKSYTINIITTTPISTLVQKGLFSDKTHPSINPDIVGIIEFTKSNTYDVSDLQLMVIFQNEFTGRPTRGCLESKCYPLVGFYKGEYFDENKSSSYKNQHAIRSIKKLTDRVVSTVYMHYKNKNIFNFEFGWA